MKLIGRIEERKSLRSALDASNSRLIAIYGRRRVGKTYLIRESFSGLLSFEITALYKKEMSLQLQHFQTTLTKHGYKSSVEKITSWFQAFDELEKYINKKKDTKKKILFMDEIPYFDTPRSNFLTAFANFWNAYCTKRKDIVLVVCGSSSSWIIKKMLRSKDGFHNRVTDIIRLMPFSLLETELFLKAKNLKWTRYDIVQLYMAVGGIPFYLDQIRKGEGLHQFIDRVCFDQTGVLYKEFDELYASLFEDSEKHYAIIKSLAGTWQGIQRDELLEKAKYKSGGNFTKALNELIEAGFISVALPHGLKKTKELYRICDPYTIFYLKFIATTKSFGRDTWMAKSRGQSYISWSGYSFESVCIQHQHQIKKALYLNVIHTEINPWKGEYGGIGAQVDILIKRDDRIIHVCEAKFSKSEFIIDKNYAKLLRTKMDVVSKQLYFKNHSIYLTLITTGGVKPNLYSQELVQNEVTLDDLFQ